MSCPSAGPSQCPQPSQAVQEPTQPVGSNSTNSHFHSSTAAELLSTSSLSHFSTLSSSLDQLISHFGPDPEQSVNGSARAKGKSRLHEGSIVPGMTLELSGPPGGGKTAIALGIALSARFGKRRGGHISGDAEDVVHDEEPGEVLIIGKPLPARLASESSDHTGQILRVP
jgi:RAD51-like protein 2